MDLALKELGDYILASLGDVVMDVARIIQDEDPIEDE